MAPIGHINGKPVFGPSRPPKRGSYFRFLDLPPEIRERVYRFLPITGFGYNNYWDGALERVNRHHPLGAPATIGDHKKPLVPAVAATCRSIRREALVSHFTNTHFIFWINNWMSNSMFAWLDRQEEIAISSIKTLSFNSFTSHSHRLTLERNMHEDAIHIDIRDATVRIDPNPIPDQEELDQLSKTYDFKWGQYCKNCDVGEVLPDMASKFKSLFKAVELDADGVRRLNKSVLRDMMDLAVGGPKMEGMKRNHIKGRPR